MSKSSVSAGSAGTPRTSDPFISLSGKRILDISVSLTLLLCLFPVLLFVALLVKVDSKGPALFGQRRYGRNCRTIFVLKFRTMYVDLCDQQGSLQASHGDPRITCVGRFLRRTAIDELPQLLNVLIGQMSLVGPRPHPISLSIGGALCENLVPGYHRRHDVLPGLTGLAQISGSRGPLQDVEAAHVRQYLDVSYIQRQGFLLDLWILMETALLPFRDMFGKVDAKIADRRSRTLHRTRRTARI